MLIFPQKNAEALKYQRQVPTILKEPRMENGDARLERYLSLNFRPAIESVPGDRHLLRLRNVPIVLYVTRT